MDGLIYVFPGQGAQKVGMGREICAQSQAASSIFDEADRVLGMPLRQICFDGPADLLTDTVNAQPAILATSLAMLAWAKTAGAPEPAALAGHSLGHFSALVAAGALDVADALSLVRVRGQAMKAAGDVHKGSMAAVIRLDAARLAEVCQQATRETGHYVGIANDNAPDQIVIAGALDALERAGQLAKEAGAKRVMSLAVSGAFHTPLMGSAVETMRRHLENIQVHAPSKPVFSNVTAAPLQTPAQIKEDILLQLTHPVRWVELVHALAQSGGATFVEIGPGAVLTGLVKRILPAATAWSLDEADGLSRLAALAGL